MNELNYKPIDSCINTLSSSTWPHDKKWKIERPELSISKHPSEEYANKLSKYWDKHTLSTLEDQAGHITPTALQITLHERLALFCPVLSDVPIHFWIAHIPAPLQLEPDWPWPAPTGPVWPCSPIHCGSVLKIQKQAFIFHKSTFIFCKTSFIFYLSCFLFYICYFTF
jgi:hypothetical protein